MVLITLTYGETKKRNLRDLSSLLDDYELLYKYFVVTAVEDYIPYSFPPIFWSRYGRPLIKEDQLEIRELSYSSPLATILVISGWIATKMLLPLVQASGEIADWSANRQRAKSEAALAALAEIEKTEDIEYKQIRNQQVRLFLEQTKYDVERSRLEQEDYEELREKRQYNALNRIEKRLASNPHQLEDIDIQLEEEQN